MPHRYNTRRSSTAEGANRRSANSQSSNSSRGSTASRRRQGSNNNGGSTGSRGSRSSRGSTPRRSEGSPTSNRHPTPSPSPSSNSRHGNLSPLGYGTPSFPDTPQSSGTAQGPSHPLKGRRIRICTGRHKGKYGWINKAKGARGLAGTTKWYVIVQEKDGTETYERNAILRTSWEYYDWSVPTHSLDEYLFVEEFEIWKKIKELNDHLEVIGGFPCSSEEEAAEQYRQFAGFFLHQFKYSNR